MPSLQRVPTIVSAREIGPAGKGGISFVIAGPPGTGKSWFLGTMAEFGDTLLIATLAREAKSVMYQQYDVDVVLLQDSGWQPTQGRFEATAFLDFLDLIDWLRDDEKYRNVIVDSGTELGEAAWHEAMKGHGVATPAEMADKKSRWLPYDQLDTYLEQAVKGIVSLTTDAKVPKNVGLSWHTQPPKDDTEVSGVTKASADSKGEGVEYEGSVLPMIRGRFRRRLAGQVDAFLLTELSQTLDRGEKSGVSLKRGLNIDYKVQVRPNPERHTKFPGILPTVTYIPNEFSAFMKLIKDSVAGTEAEASDEAEPVQKKRTKGIRPRRAKSV